MTYQIHRECWNGKTYNGYTDSPYWRISFSFYEIGLKDNGEFWYINNSCVDNNELNWFVITTLHIIIKECKLKIKLKWKRKNK